MFSSFVRWFTLVVLYKHERERDFLFEKKRARAAKISEKRSRDCLLPASKEKLLLPVFGPSDVPILNENMAKSSPLSRNDQTFCCPFPISGFRIVPSVSSSSSSLPRRARCSFNAFNAFISFFFWITQSDFQYYPPPACCCKSEITKRTTEKKNKTLSLSLSSQKRRCVRAFSSRVKSNDTPIYY